MAIDSTLAIRRGMLTLAKHDDALTDLVPAASIYPQVTPAKPGFPFIRYGAPSSTPIRASCTDGGEWTVAMHAFGKGRYENDTLIETAEDHTSRIGAVLARALDRHAIDLDQGRATIRWTGSQLLMDPNEPDCFHAIVNFRVRAITG